MSSLQSPTAQAGNMFSPSLAGTSSSHGHQPAEVFRKDLISAMKLPDSHQLQPDEYMVITDTWKQEWEKGVQVPVSPDSIPAVSCTATRDPDPGTFKMPRKLICTAGGTSEQEEYAAALLKKLESVCQYDLDEVDEQWLDIVNQEREDMNDPPIDEFTMERIIEECETQCHKNMEHAMQTEEGLGIEYDDDVICDVCRAPDCEEGNEMVFCDKCDICVHQACYGIVKVPEGSWMCRTCALGLQPVCLLCGKKGGAMKSTRSGTKWAHVSCALWIPEVSIGCVERMEPITKISQIPVSRWALICNLCRIRTGACIQCSVKTCKVAYHVTCGFQNNLEMKTFLDEEVEVRFRSYCLKHSKKRNPDSDPDGSPQKTPSTGTPKKEKSIEEKDNERAIRIQNITEDFYKYAKAKDVASNLNMKDDLEIVDLVFEYWKLKRKSGFNKPLVVLQKEESPSDNEEYSLHARMRMFVHLRQDLERVRNLCYMVQKREKLSRQMASLREDIFRKQQQIFSGDVSRFSPEDLEFAEQAVALSAVVPEKAESTFDLFSEVSVDEDKANEEVKLVEDIVVSNISRSEMKSESENYSSSSETESYYCDSRSSSRAELSKPSETEEKSVDMTPLVESQILEVDSKRSVVVEGKDQRLYQRCEPKRAQMSLSHTPELPYSVKGSTVRQNAHLKRTAPEEAQSESIQTKRKSRNGRYSHNSERKSKITSYFKTARSDSSQLDVKQPREKAGTGQMREKPTRQAARHHRQTTLSPRQLQMKEEAARLREQMFASSPASRAILSGYRIPKKKSIPSSESSPPAMEADTAPPTSSQPPPPKEDRIRAATPETRSVRRRIEDELDRESNCSDRQFENIDAEVSICLQGKEGTPSLPSSCDSEDDIIIVDDDHQEQLTKQLLAQSLSSSGTKLSRGQSVDSPDVDSRVSENKPVTTRIYDAAYRLLNSAIPL
ncbi:protein Jade-3-like [Acanthaster planci]|uniref:Protein Jade-3-like n=1 Tax=Acanthaster planci TaxID=133434 RepID=A0A8B7XWB2_ACAPL|nr:protein Jade-3-like [Acanthaster planci]XP_022084538.1 protein Jade-3-like [Acanthaster planci]